MDVPSETSWVLVIAAAVVTALGDVTLRVLRRRARAAALRPGGAARTARAAGAALAVARILLWSAVTWIVAGMLPAVRPWRDLLPVVAEMSLTAPLVPVGDRQSSVLHLLALPVVLVALWFVVGRGVRRLVARAQRLAGFDRGVSDHAACFVGREAVDWLVRALALTRDEAVAVGRTMMAHGLVRHVLGERDFEDADLYYRFHDAAIDGNAVGVAGMMDGEVMS